MLRRLAALGAGASVLVAAALSAGCGQAPAGEPRQPRGLESYAPPPAAAAGGACQLLDYPTIEHTIGVRFDAAAASRTKHTYACALRAADSGHNLVLTVTPTTADPQILLDTVAPRGAKTVKGLGLAGYRAADAGKSGAWVEVGWLSGDSRILVLRYSAPAGTTTAAIERMVPKVVALAKRVDQARL